MPRTILLSFDSRADLHANFVHMKWLQNFFQNHNRTDDFAN